jgi:uncharacterized surface protein with fasciclin (FAS1) repeats
LFFVLWHFETVTLCEAIQLTGLDNDLTMEEWTVFAPTDLAFEVTLGEENVNWFMNNTSAFTNLLLFHVLPTPMLSLDFVCQGQEGSNLMTMANGQQSRT